MQKSPHVIWVCPNNNFFFRSKGEVKCRPGSVIPKLVNEGVKINALIPFDPLLLPKTKLSSTRLTRHTLTLSEKYSVGITKLTRGSLLPGVYMVSIPTRDPALWSALFCKAAMALAQQLKRPVDIFHLFDWQTGLFPLFLGLEKNGSRIFKNSKTFFYVESMQEYGSYSPTVLKQLGLPVGVFHPEGIEFYGRVNYLKSGLMFSDRVGWLNGKRQRSKSRFSGPSFDGVLNKQTEKIKKWASPRSLNSHIEVYEELMNAPMQEYVFFPPSQNHKSAIDETRKIIETWGPVPPDRLHVNTLSFLIQSPTKAYVFWEWVKDYYMDYGLRLIDCLSKRSVILSRGVGPVGEYWITVEPDHEYIVELIGYLSDFNSHPLLRSRLVRTPRIFPSANRNAIFIDTRNQKQFRGPIHQDSMLTSKIRSGGTSAFEWSEAEWLSSLRETVSSR
ncbi:MAG: Glycogen synthase [Elusimicrobia bacterium]|nr:Glycogen synthase [Elusimicrobiota bacterium]